MSHSVDSSSWTPPSKCLLCISLHCCTYCSIRLIYINPLYTSTVNCTIYEGKKVGDCITSLLQPLQRLFPFPDHRGLCQRERAMSWSARYRMAAIFLEFGNSVSEVSMFLLKMRGDQKGTIFAPLTVALSCICKIGCFPSEIFVSCV